MINALPLLWIPCRNSRCKPNSFKDQKQFWCCSALCLRTVQTPDLLIHHILRNNTHTDFPMLKQLIWLGNQCENTINGHVGELPLCTNQCDWFMTICWTYGKLLMGVAGLSPNQYSLFTPVWLRILGYNQRIRIRKRCVHACAIQLQPTMIDGCSPWLYTLVTDSSSLGWFHSDPNAYKRQARDLLHWRLSATTILQKDMLN